MAATIVTLSGTSTADLQVWARKLQMYMCKPLIGWRRVWRYQRGNRQHNDIYVIFLYCDTFLE